MARFDAMTIRVMYLGQTIMCEFKGGRDARIRARLTTSDPFVQDALESDPRYGTLYHKLREYVDCPSLRAQSAEQDRKPKRITKVRDINSALMFLSSLGATITGEQDLPALMEKYNVEFPNLKLK